MKEVMQDLEQALLEIHHQRNDHQEEKDEMRGKQGMPCPRTNGDKL